MRHPGFRSTAAIVATLSLGLAACGSDDGASTDEESSPDSADAATDGAADAATTQADEPAADGEIPTIVVTTNVLGDVVKAVVGDSAEVITIMPVGADPHDFQASAQEVNAMNNADALIVNGAGFEEGLLDVIESAEDEGVATFEAISVVDTIEFGEGGHDHADDEHDEDEDHDHEDEHSDDEEHSDEDHDHADDHEHDEDEDHDHSDEDEHSDDEDHEDHDDEDHDDEEHSDEEHSDGDEHSDDEEHSDGDHDDHEGHDHSGEDPHFFTDPARMVDAVEGIVDFLQDEIDFADPAAVDASADAYIARLTELDGTVAELVESIPDDRRVLVTNHEVFGYFADRYDFEVVGAVIPGGSTTDNASAGELAELAEQVEAEGVPAIFSDTSSSDDLVEALAAEVGDVAIVELYTESLGEAGSDGATYLQMVLTNAERMSSALG